MSDSSQTAWMGEYDGATTKASHFSGGKESRGWHLQVALLKSIVHSYSTDSSIAQGQVMGISLRCGTRLKQSRVHMKLE